MFAPGLTAVVLALAANAQSRPPGTVVRGDLGEQLERAALETVSQIEKESPFWGVMLAASDAEVVFARGFGPADRSTSGRRRRDMSTRSLFDLGAAGQMLTALLVLRLASDGTLALEDPVRRHLADWPADRELTIDQLLRHSSGMSVKGKWPRGSGMSARLALAAVANAPVVGQPGVDWRYTDLNPILLALLVESAAGGYERALRRHVLKPFGMKDADVLGGSFSSKYLTTRRSLKGDERADKLFFNWHQRGVSGVLATALDVHALLAGVTGGKLLDARERDLWWRPVPAGRLRVEQADLLGTRLRRIDGRCEGYRTRWTIHPESRSWVVLCAGDTCDLDAVEVALVGVLAPAFRSGGPGVGDGAGASEPPAPTTTPPPTATSKAGSSKAGSPTAGGAIDAEVAARFVGTFTVPNGGRFEIRDDGGSLQLVAAGVEPSTRLLEGVWPGRTGAAAGQYADRGIAILERLADGDATVVDDGFVSGTAATAASTTVAGLLADHGALARVRYVGSIAERGRVESWFALDFEDHAPILQVRWRGSRKFTSCRPSAEPPPFAVALTIVGPDAATATSPAGTMLRLTMEGRPGDRTLVFEDGTVGEDGLLDCPELGSQ